MNKKYWPLNNEVDFCGKDLFWVKKNDEEIKAIKYILLIFISVITELCFFLRRKVGRSFILSDSNSLSTLRVENYILSKNNDIEILTKLPQRRGMCVLFNFSGCIYKKEFYFLIKKSFLECDSFLEKVASIFNVIFYFKIISFLSKGIKHNIILSHTSTSISSVLYNYSNCLKIYCVQHGNPSNAFFPSPVDTYLVFDNNYKSYFEKYYKGEIVVAGVPWDIKFIKKNEDLISKKDAVFLSQIFSSEINTYEHIKALSIFVDYCKCNNLNPVVKPHPRDKNDYLTRLGHALGFNVLDVHLSNCVNAYISFSMFSTALYELKVNGQIVGQIIPYSSSECAFCFSEYIYSIDGWTKKRAKDSFNMKDFNDILMGVLK